MSRTFTGGLTFKVPVKITWNEQAASHKLVTPKTTFRCELRNHLLSVVYSHANFQAPSNSFHVNTLEIDILILIMFLSYKNKTVTQVLQFASQYLAYGVVNTTANPC